MVFTEFIIGVLLGALVGMYVPKLLQAYEKKRLESTAVEKIEKQDLDYIIDGKKYDLVKAAKGENPVTNIQVPRPIKASKVKKEVKKSAGRSKAKGRKKA